MAKPGTCLGTALHTTLRKCASWLKVTNKNGQMGILDLQFARTVTEGEAPLAAAMQYLEEHTGSTLNSARLSCSRIYWLTMALER